MPWSADERHVRRLAVAAWFGVHRSAAEILVHLAEAAAPIDGVSLAAMCRTTPRAIQVRVSQLRAAMETEAVDSIPLLGYSLTEVGRAEFEAAVDHFRRAIAA